MQTSYFQLSLMLVMAAALGATVSSSPAIGYPAASAISTGSNPIWNVGGRPSSVMYFEAPSDQDMVITDIYYGSSSSGWLRLTFKLGDTDIAAYAFNGSTNMSLTSGIRVPAGQTLTARFEAYTGFSNSRYTFSGYYTQP